MDELRERIARALAARVIGLVEDPLGQRLPFVLWSQGLDHADVVLAAVREEVMKPLVSLLGCWQSYGCPDCGGDCASANPPVSMCIMRETRDTIDRITKETRHG